MSRLLSSFAERWQDVPAPQLPLYQIHSEYNEISNYGYKYPFNNPTPAGTFEVMNASVDKSQRVGAWSEPFTATVKSGWRLYARGDNQKPMTDEVGIVWKVKCVSLDAPDPLLNFEEGDEYLYVTASEIDQDSWRSIVAYSMVEPVYRELKEPNTRRWTLSKLAMGGRNQTVASPPSVIFTQLPLRPKKFAYARLTHTGLTELSPPMEFILPVLPGGVPASETCQIQFQIREPHPQGTLGYYLYECDEAEGVWRQIFNRFTGTSIYQINDKQPIATDVTTAGFLHVAASEPKSYLGLLNVALMDTGESIIVDMPAVKHYCPVIDEWRSTGDVTFYRTITGQYGEQWELQHEQLPDTIINYYPNVHIYNSYSTWVGCRSNRNSPLPAGLTFADWSGGQCFGNGFKDCQFGNGVQVLENCTGGTVGGHTASELDFANCDFGGMIPIWLAGQQTANVRFSRTRAAIFGTASRLSAAVYIDTPNQVRFKDGLNADCPGNAIFVVTRANLLLEDPWIDQGFITFIDVAAWGWANVIINGGKLNAWANLYEVPNLLRNCNPTPYGGSKLVLNNVNVQFNNSYALHVLNPMTNAVELRFEDTPLNTFTILREPSKQQSGDLQQYIYGEPSPLQPIPEPGYIIQIPQQSSDINTSGVVQVIIPAQTVRQNSITGQAKVSRSNWTS